MVELYKAFEDADYRGHEVSVFLIRLLFLNFGDRTDMWKKDLFAESIADCPDNYLGYRLQDIFRTLNTPESDRRNLPADLQDFPYVNGGIFQEDLEPFIFTPEMRDALVETTRYDWKDISPAIFGAMFQLVKDKPDRRALGEHYTSEANILKVIRPLFLDEYERRRQAAWNSIPALKRLQQELSRRNYLDPAAGSGNFLIVAYQELRKLETKIFVRLLELEGRQGDQLTGLDRPLGVNLGQFYAIEINEWSAQIAKVALILTDHQANRKLTEVTGMYLDYFPLKNNDGNIFLGNALKKDWSELCPMQNTFIMGNPPFIGARNQTDEQKRETVAVWQNSKAGGKGCKDLDYVTNWFMLATRHAQNGAKAAFVATSSIAQGEQPGIIWSRLGASGMGIDFAHRPFNWKDNPADKTGGKLGVKGAEKAAVHCVIIGFSQKDKSAKTKRKLWSYDIEQRQAAAKEVDNINAYLLDGPDLLITARRKPLQTKLPIMLFGSQPNDGGHISKLDTDTAEQFRKDYPTLAKKYLKPIIGAEEMLHNRQRFCLWLPNANDRDFKTCSFLSERREKVRKHRQSKKIQRIAPSLFASARQPTAEYIAIPRVSSEKRYYVPIAIYPAKVIATEALQMLPNLPSPGKYGFLTTFGVLHSQLFNLWNKTVSGRLDNRVRISIEITYNNFPLPDLDEKSSEVIAQGAQAVLDTRNKFPGNSLADLYDSLSMPAELRKAHDRLDKAVLKVFGLPPAATDEQALSRLFSLYDDMTRGLLPKTPIKRRRR